MTDSVPTLPLLPPGHHRARLAAWLESRTVRNLAATGTVRLALGPTRDVSLVDGVVEVLDIDALPADRADAFARRAGFDPRPETTPYCWLAVSPRRIQAWREADELAGRELMRDGRWLVGPR